MPLPTHRADAVFGLMITWRVGKIARAILPTLQVIDMLIINNDDVAALLTMADCIRVQEEAFRKLPTGGAMHRPRIDMYFPCERDDGYFRWGSMEGANDGYFAIRMKSDVITWPKDADGNWTEEKYCREPGPHCGLVFLLSTRNGEPLAFIND